MKHAWKICILLGILIVCLLLPVSSIHEGFKRRARKKIKYKRRLRRKSCEYIKDKMDKNQDRTNHYKYRIANEIYQEKNCNPAATAAESENCFALAVSIKSQLDKIYEKIDNMVSVPPWGEEK